LERPVDGVGERTCSIAMIAAGVTHHPDRTRVATAYDDRLLRVLAETAHAELGLGTPS
jgi:hypothetical protein